jgi:UDP-N-acetylmuramate--L-alanine ligase
MMKPKLLFIGIVGHAMRGLALAAKLEGNTVTGLDEAADEGPGASWLAKHGLPWTRQAEPKLLDGIDAVIISGGTPADYPLLEEAKRRGIKIQSFAEYLGEITAGEHSIVIAGTHGKSTTSAFVAWLLEHAGRRPDYLVGIRPFNFDSSARLGGGKMVVIEGDEYKASSLDPKAKLEYYHPDLLVLTSVEHDHPDVYPDLASVIERFKLVVGSMPKDGRLVVWAESSTVAEVASAAVAPLTTYGLEKGDYTARDISYLPTGIEFDIQKDRQILGRIAVQLYGKHNVLNTLAASAVALVEGLTLEELIGGAAQFKGTYRRFSVLTPTDADITVVDDYAHHPSEVATNIEGAKLHFPGRRIVTIFRPHTYSRTKALLSEYRRAFDQADLIYITDIEGAREAGIEHSVSGNDIVQGLSRPALYTPQREDLISRLKRDCKPGDVVLCFSVSGYQNLAGDLTKELN